MERGGIFIWCNADSCVNAAWDRRHVMRRVCGRRRWPSTGTRRLAAHSRRPVTHEATNDRLRATQTANPSPPWRRVRQPIHEDGLDLWPRSMSNLWLTPPSPSSFFISSGSHDFPTSFTHSSFCHCSPSSPPVYLLFQSVLYVYLSSKHFSTVQKVKISSKNFCKIHLNDLFLEAQSDRSYVLTFIKGPILYPASMLSVNDLEKLHRKQRV